MSRRRERQRRPDRFLVLIQIAQRVWPPAVVHDTVRAAARDLVFRRNISESIGQRIMMWIGDAITHFIRSMRDSSVARPLGFVIVVIVVLLVLVRLVIATRARDEAATSGASHGRAGVRDDPFASAEHLAAEGRYEEAAHALYRGVLLSLSRTERLRLDASKTSGDYGRELRARGSTSYQSFRAFARRFDVAVFGHGRCDADLIVDLRRLAEPLASRARAA
jgi:hypothetical protein